VTALLRSAAAGRRSTLLSPPHARRCGRGAPYFRCAGFSAIEINHTGGASSPMVEARRVIYSQFSAQVKSVMIRLSPTIHLASIVALSLTATHSPLHAQSADL